MKRDFYYAERGYATVSCPSVCLSVRPVNSICLGAHATF